MSITIPDGVTSIGDGAFSGCYKLANVTIPNSITNIGIDAFRGCSYSLFDTATIPGVKLVDGWAVGYTDSLPAQLDLTGVRGIGRNVFSINDEITSVTIGNSVTSIGDFAFQSCYDLTSVTIPDSVRSIGNDAFANCTSLESVTITSNGGNATEVQ